MNKIPYLGHIIDKDGRRPDPERATVIKDVPTPDNVTTLQSFLGLANNYQSFIKNLYDLRAPLNEQLKKDKKWRWTPEFQTAFDQIKKASGTPTDKALQQFLQVYRITPNPNTPLAVSPAETMFARKIRSVFDKLLPKRNKLRKTTLAPKKRFNPGEEFPLKKYQNNTFCWERGII